MKNVIRLVILATLCVANLQIAKAEVAPAPYFASLVETDAQRLLLSDSTGAYLAVNGQAMIAEGQLDAEAVTASGIEAALKSLAASADPFRIRLVAYYGPPFNTPAKPKSAFKELLRQMALEAGFESASVTEISTSQPWNDKYRSIGEADSTRTSPEPVYEDEQIRGYPLRTPLSRWLVGDADYAVEIRKSFDGRKETLGESLGASVRKAVASVEWGPSKGRLLFRVSTTTAGEEVMTRLFDAREPVRIPEDLEDPALLAILQAQADRYRPSEAMKLAMEMGFQKIGCIHSPNGGAPEKRIGQPAPNFKLRTLDGDELQLGQFAQGRPMLLTFWGVACGPCVKEAPHLTRMYQKYGQEMAFVAVNAYNESAEVVRRFADERQIKHPILLQGRSVARELYSVGAYPTTFWVNAEGMVVDYEVGFDSPELLEHRIQRMLNSAE